MAPKRPVKAQPPAKGGAKKKKTKGGSPADKLPMQRVMVINEQGKKQMVWREWGA